jgi:putative transposase
MVRQTGLAEESDELLNGDILYRLKQATLLIEQWRHHHNTMRPPSALGHRPTPTGTFSWPGASG